VGRPDQPVRKPLREQPRPSLTPRRRLFFRLAAAVLVPLFLLGAVEAALRLAGYGYSTSFFKPLRIGGEDFLVENEKFGWRFFPPEISRSPSPTRMLAHKKPGTYRVFLFGESAALGDPQPAFGMGRYLQALLRERYPGTEFEVVCVAMTAINSHAVLPIARECAHQDGDLWIIYMGNNEMIGPFGATTIFGSQSPPLAYVRLSVALQRTRLGQLLMNLGRRLTNGAGKHGPSWGGMQMFIQNRIAPNQPRKEPVYHSFQRNLEDLLRAGRSAGIPMLLSTVGVNLKDCAPFSSLSGRDLSAADQAEFDRIYSEGTEAQNQGKFAEAAAKLEQAARLNPDWAELQFRWGQCLLSQSNAASAAAHFELARDDDALPFRADTRLNRTITETARRFAGPDLAMCDAVSLFSTNSPAGIPGDELFYEHVHLNFSGNYLLARALADRLAPMLPARIARQAMPSWATQETCENDIGLTDWNRRDVFEEVRRRFRQPPFTGRADNAEKGRAWQVRLEQLQHQLNATNVEPARRIYLEAIGRWPKDFRLHWNYADFLESIRQPAEAVAEWKKVQALIPQHHLAYYQIGRLLAQLGQPEEARSWLTRAVGLRPDLSEAWYELGRIQAGTGQFEAALQSFDRARVLVPAEPRYHFELGKVLIKLNRSGAAMAQLHESVQLGRDFWEAHYLLGEQLAFAGQIRLARQEFEEALRIQPAYPMAHFNLGVALVKEGNLDEARRQFEEVLRLDPQNQQAAAFLQRISTGINH